MKHKTMMARTAVWLVLLTTITMLAGCDGGGGNNLPAVEKKRVAPNARLGKDLFAAKCAGCHGRAGIGTAQGPPLVHRIYEPGHHPDFTFYRAVTSGVRQHHWQFGDMPPIAGVSMTDTSHIVAYVRQEQQQAGIY